MKKMFRSLAALVFGCLAVLTLAAAFGRSKATVHAAPLAAAVDDAGDDGGNDAQDILEGENPNTPE